MNLTELRLHAKSLRAAVASGDAAAIKRVLASHPKYVGRPADRLDHARFALRDAQLVIAREHGYEHWSDIISAESTTRQVRSSERDFRLSAAAARAMGIAGEHGDSSPTLEHMLLALLSPPRPTVASTVLRELGISSEQLMSALPVGPRKREEDRGVITSNVLLSCEAFARALALAEGTALSDEHLLMAMLYEGRAMQGGWYHRTIDPDEIYEALRDRGVRVPATRPPAVEPTRGPMGPRLYVVEPEASNVTRVLRERYPPRPDVPMWGLNHSRWKPGHLWFDAEDEIDIAGIAREALAPGVAYEVVPFKEAVHAEMAVVDADRL